MQQELPFPSEPDPEPTLLASLLQRAGLYCTSKSHLELLEFVARMPNIAPFNVMLLHIQKPGLRFAATAYDWKDRFNRTVREGARPMVILWPFSPVAFVYDIEDTSGDPLPQSVAHAFQAFGNVTHSALRDMEWRLQRLGIHLGFIEFGDGYGGHIQAEGVTPVLPSHDRKTRPIYRVRINSAHDPNVQFGALAHELGHLFLGHLGDDQYLKIPDRSFLGRDGCELEAESVAYLVCHRAGVELASESYLAHYLAAEGAAAQIDVYAIMRAAGRVESALGIAIRSRIK